MRKIILISFLLFFSFSLNAQNISKKFNANKTNISNVTVTINAKANISNKKNIFDSDLILEISKLQPLFFLNVKNINGINNLTLKLRFKNTDSFHKWFKNSDVKEIIKKIKMYAPNITMELELTKAIKAL